MAGCDQLVVGPTYARGGLLNLLMTDFPNLARVAIIAPIGNSLLSAGGHFDGTDCSKLVC